MSTTGDLVSREYRNFRGVDFRGEEVNLARSPDSLNMWKDYKGLDSIRTRPAVSAAKTVNENYQKPIYGIFHFKDKTLYHQGPQLSQYTGNTTAASVLYSPMNEHTSHAFVFDDKLYIIDGKNYLVYDGSTCKEVVGYIPKTSISRKPSGSGTHHEDVNLLNSFRYNTFTGDGVSKVYKLDAENIVQHTVEVEVDGVVLDGHYSVNAVPGEISFHDGYEPTLSDSDNVKIKFQTVLDETNEQKYASQIKNCTLCQVFDNRVFFSGNDNFPNKVWHCSLYDPTYWSDTDYYEEGLDSAKVTGLVAGSDALMVFREPSASNTSVFYHRPVTDYEYGKIYPSQHSSISTGCVGGAINFNDDIVFFSERGMEGVRIDKITSEQVLEHRSSLVDRKMLAETKYKDMILVEWEGYLMVFIGSHVYLADSRAVFNNVDHIEYEWFYWNIGFTVTTADVRDSKLWLGSIVGGIYTMEYSSTADKLESYWTTPKDKFNAPNKLKTTNKNGCIVEATGDIEVLVKTNNDPVTEESDGFESVGKHNDVKDFIASRIKKKKFKDIQLKFKSNTWFTLESATLECFVGGYLKRGGGE